MRTKSIGDSSPGGDPRRSLRILWISKVPPEYRAPRIWQVARRLASRGHDVRVIAARTESELPSQRVLDGVCLRYIATAPRSIIDSARVGFYASRLPWYVVAARAASSWIEREPVDVVIEDLSPVGSVMVDRSMRRLGVPLVQDVHYLLGGPSAWVRMYGPIGLWGATYERWLRSGRVSPAALVSDNRPLLDRLVRRRPDVPMTWIPNGVDPARHPSGARPVDGRIRVLAVGRLAPPKGHQVLIDAMAELRDRPDIGLSIVGDGPIAGRLEARIRELDLTATVELVGRVAWEDLNDVYAAADIFAMPSFAEGLPIALVEALASGPAVIASDIPGHRQIADDRAIAFVPVGDPAALAGEIRSLADDPARRRAMSDEGRRVVAERYTWDIVADRWEQLLLDVSREAQAA